MEGTGADIGKVYIKGRGKKKCRKEYKGRGKNRSESCKEGSKDHIKITKHVTIKSGEFVEKKTLTIGFLYLCTIYFIDL